MSIEITRSDLTRIVVAVDPATTANEDSDDTGIVVVARGPHQPSTCKIPYCPGHGYVLDDQTSKVKLLPHQWAALTVATYDKWQADRIVAETNNGGDMVGTTIHAVRAGIAYSKVTATRGKVLRAEPCSALYEQGRVHHIGCFPELEQEQETWTPDSNWSPNRVDALVWGLTYLGLVGGQGAAFVTSWRQEVADRPTHQVPAALRQLPRTESDAGERQIAQEKCKGGKNHRFQEWPDGSYTCPVCGGRKAEGGRSQ